MNPRHILALLLLTGLPLLGAPALLQLLPPPPSGAWKPEGEPAEFTGDTLWNLMDGGAELYQEYGVNHALSLSYAGEGGTSLSLELYEMRDELAAYGIYSLQARALKRDRAGGAELALSGDYLLLRKGRYFATITRLGSQEGGLEPCLALAKLLAGRLQGNADKPRLPAEISAAPIYVRGSIGLGNLYAFGATDPFRTREAVAAYREGGLDILLCQEGDAEAAERLAAAWKILSSNPKYKVLPETSAPGSLLGEHGETITLRQEGKILRLRIAPWPR